MHDLRTAPLKSSPQQNARSFNNYDSKRMGYISLILLNMLRFLFLKVSFLVECMSYQVFVSVNDVYEFNAIRVQCPTKVNFCHP